MQSVCHAAIAGAFAFAIAGWALRSSYPLAEGGAAGASAIHVQDDCEDLRQGCLHRNAMNERGQGNCRRFRDRCGISPEYCALLLETCIQKKARGSKDVRSCRHYRLECRQARL